MRFFVSILIGLLTLVALLYSAYRHMPVVRKVSKSVVQTVYEEVVRKEPITVEVNGQKVTVEIERRYAVSKPVYEFVEHKIAPTALQKLQFWSLLGVAILFGAYMAFVLGLWTRDKILRRRESADTLDTEKRVEGIITFCSGILIGFLGTVDLSEGGGETSTETFPAHVESYGPVPLPQYETAPSLETVPPSPVENLPSPAPGA